MGKQIISKPEAIRAAGDNISSLDVKTSYSSFPSTLTSSDGLVAEGINEIIEELKTIEGLVDGILKKLPGKLDKVATIIEQHDNAAASQFK